MRSFAVHPDDSCPQGHPSPPRSHPNRRICRGSLALILAAVRLHARLTEQGIDCQLVEHAPGQKYSLYFYDPNGIRLELFWPPADGEEPRVIDAFTQTKVKAREELKTKPGSNGRRTGCRRSPIRATKVLCRATGHIFSGNGARANVRSPASSTTRWRGLNGL